MEQDFWLNRWQTNEIQFHSKEAYPALVEYFLSLPRGKVLVPLAGKSVDMLWLATHGFHVLGVELSPIACEAFFKENKLSYELVQNPDFTIYRSHSIELWCGDFLKLPLQACADINLIYDKAALFALPETIRSEYVAKIKQLAQNLSSLEMLLITVEFPQDLKEGPPFVVTEKQVHNLYSDTFKIKKLSAISKSGFRDHPKFKNIPIKDVAYWLTKN